MLTSLIPDMSTKLFAWSLALHWFFDWIMQNHHLATYKTSLRHPASYIHSGLHLIGLLLVFPWWMALLIALSHLIIDTRVPLRWWRKFYKQTTTGDVALHVAIWVDQAFHVVVLAIAALIVGGLR